MRYVQELIMIISDVQIAFLPPLESASLNWKNFWHFSTCQQLLNSFRQLFSASILPHSQVLFYKHVLLRIPIKKSSGVRSGDLEGHLIVPRLPILSVHESFIQ